MAKQTSARRQDEKQVLDQIGGRAETPAPGEAAPARPAPAKPAGRIGWMVVTGSVLWAACFGGAGLIAWLVLANGG